MGCTVDTLTLSTEQKALAEKRIREAGVEDKATVHLMDYRCMPPEFEKAFDACVSIEMLEVSNMSPRYRESADKTIFIGRWRRIHVNLHFEDRLGLEVGSGCGSAYRHHIP